MKELFDEMERKGLVSTSSSWLERGVRQKNPRITIELARTKLDGTFHGLDFIDYYIVDKEWRN